MSIRLGNGKYVRAARAVMTTGGAFVINFMIQMLLTPYITETVGAEAYGFVSLAKNFAQYAAVLTAALNSFASRHIAVAYHEGDKKRANVFFSSVFWGDVALGTGLMLVMLPVILFLDRFLHISPALVRDVKWLFLLVFFNFWLVTVGCAFESSAIIQSKLDVTGLYKGLSYLTEAVVLCLMYLLLPANVSYVGIGLIAASVVVVAGNYHLCRRVTPDLVAAPGAFSLTAVKRLVIDGIWTSVNSLGEILNNGLDLMVCNFLLSPLHMGQVAIAKTVHGMFIGLFVIINPAFQPMFLKSYAEKDLKTLRGELGLAMKVSGMLANVAFAGFAALGLCFYRLWIPTQDVKLIYELTLINCLTLIPGGPMQPLYYIYTLTVKRKVPCLVTLLGGLFNVAGMYVLITYTKAGVYAVVWTTAVVMMVINFVTNPLYMAHVLELPLKTFYPEILRNVLSCACLTAVFRLLTSVYQPHTWLSLALTAAVLAVIGAGAHLLIVLRREEYEHLYAIIRKRRAE